MQKAQERLYFTADKDRLVGEGDKRAAFLYAAIGDEIPNDAVARFGLVDGRLKGAAKEKRADEDKEKKDGGNKGASSDLTRVKGIGGGRVKHLEAAGITTVAQLAAVDPANPPAMIAGVGEADWTVWVEGAKALITEQ